MTTEPEHTLPLSIMPNATPLDRGLELIEKSLDFLA